MVEYGQIMSESAVGVVERFGMMVGPGGFSAGARLVEGDSGVREQVSAFVQGAQQDVLGLQVLIEPLSAAFASQAAVLNAAEGHFA